MKYQLPDLHFEYDALEPFIDARTMNVHHLGHHKTYVDKLNETFADRPDLQLPVEELLTSVDSLPLDMVSSVRNNGGGHANHTLFWTLLTPKSTEGPTDELESKIRSTFGSFPSFKERFTEISTKHFASGWAWLATDSEGELHIFSTKDHRTPISEGMTPLLVLDLWEHAYYLEYQNRRPEYVKAFWNVLNWYEVGERWNEFQRSGHSVREWKMTG